MNNFPPPPPPLDDSDNTPITIKYSAAQQDSDIPKNWVATVADPLPSIRCQHIKKDGNRCGAWGLKGTDGRCLRHGGNLPAVKAAAATRVERARLMMMGSTMEAYDVLQALMQPGIAEGIRLKAATEILDRAGLKAGQEINVTVEHIGSPLEDIMNQLDIIAGHREPVLDAEEIFDAEEVEEA